MQESVPERGAGLCGGVVEHIHQVTLGERKAL